MATNVEESSSSTFDTEDKHGSELVQQVDDSNLPLQENSVLDVTAQKKEDESGSELNCLRVEEPGVKGSESEVAGLRAEMERLQQELKGCVGELQKVQKQLSQSERLQQITERYNQDLRQQVEKLSMEIHEQKKKKKNMVEAETQTEEYTWTETDYYNYYYGGYHQPVAENTAEVVQNVSMATQETSEVTEMYPMATESATVHPELPGEESEINSSEGCVQQVGDGGSSIADMLKATAEEALTQTSFVFDESSGMYYDHATGFYYDSSNQLYYDASTGMYYYYDPDSGKYQFHSRIELPAVQLPAQDDQTSYIQEKIVRKKCKKNSDKTTHVDNGDQGGKVDESKIIKRQGEHVEDVKLEKSARRKEHRACSKKQCHDEARGNRTRSASRRKGKSQKRSRSRSKEKHKKKKKKKKKSRECTEKRSRSDNTSESEPEEGEITGSEKEKEHSTSSSSSASPLTASPPSSPTPDSPGIEMQTQEEAWPPCVRVTVVRSPILEPGTLFILTADSLATIGREKDMNHAIRIPEIGVSKSHAEVYFDQDQQCYMLVDQGSQNGTVINGSRILQPKVRCDPCPLTHGDEVKVGETVLSFHIHSGTNTCDGCEPGQVRAHLNRHPRKKEAGAQGCTLSKEDKELLRQRELKQMKLKYGLETSDYEDSSVLKNSKYKDRAESRRHKVGSEGTFHRDDAPASLHVEISEVNKGRQMLEKMGWKSGEGLGRDGAGITEPIGLQVRPAQSGLGSSTALSVEDASVCRSRNQQNWERARERFLHTQTPTSTPKAQPAWVKGQPQSDP